MIRKTPGLLSDGHYDDKRGTRENRIRMVLEVYDKCADPSPRFTDTVRREEVIGTRPNKASRIERHISREHESLYMCRLQRRMSRLSVWKCVVEEAGYSVLILTGD